MERQNTQGTLRRTIGDVHAITIEIKRKYLYDMIDILRTAYIFDKYNARLIHIYINIYVTEKFEKINRISYIS